MAQVKLDINADEKDFLKGVDNAADALETLIDGMDDAEKESLRSANKIEASLKDVTEAAQDAGKATRPIGKGFKDAAEESSEGLQEIKDESKSTAKEAAASFDGSAESIVDAFQEVAANAFAGFGAAGLVAGLAAAAGIGIATQAFQANSEEAEAAKEKIRELGVAIIESGDDAALLEYVTENLKDIITEADGAAVKLDELTGLSRRFPAFVKDIGTLAVAYAGNADAADLMVEKLTAEAKQIDEVTYHSKIAADAASQRSAELRRVAGELEDVAEQTRRAQELESEWLAAGGAELQARAEMVSAIDAAYDDAAASATDYVNAESGLFDTTAYITAMQEREAALDAYQSNLASSELSTEAKAFLNEQGVEAAAQMLAGYTSGDAATKKELNRIWTSAGKEGSGAADKVIKDTFKTPYEAKVKAEADTATAEKALSRLVQERTAKIQVKFVDKYGKVVD